MSRSCLLIEVSPGAWHYLLEDEATSGAAWDWCENATAYGPFESMNEAFEHRADNHADVSGTELRSFAEGLTVEAVILDRIAEALGDTVPTY